MDWYWSFFLFLQDRTTEKSSMYCAERDCCECTAHRDFAAGDPITIFYGERSNADFLLHNSFVYPENHHDSVKIKFGISNSDAYLLRMGLLKKLKLPASGEYLITCNKQDPVHSSLLAFLRVFKMTEGTFDWISILRFVYETNTK